MNSPWLNAFGLSNPDGELLAGTGIRAVRNHTRMVPIGPDALRDHLYMLYIESDDPKELLTVARCLRAVLGLDLRVGHDRRGRPYLWRAQPAAGWKTRASFHTRAGAAQVAPAEDDDDLRDEVPEGYDSWGDFWMVNDPD